MFFISIPMPDADAMFNGTPVEVTINGHKTKLRFHQEYVRTWLTYTDEEGIENVCPILKTTKSGNIINYFCASHEQDPAECTVIDPLGDMLAGVSND